MTPTIERMSPAIGARVTGVDLAQPLDNETFSAIFDAFNRYSLLVVPEQRITPEQQVEFSRRFGRLEAHVLADNLLSGLPEIYVVSNVVEGGKAQGRAKAGWFWHTDLSYQAEPALGSFLYALEVPECGGDTMFASTAAAYDALSDTMKSLLADLRAVHDFRQGYQKYSSRWAEPMPESAFAARPPVEHPIVGVHPETGRKLVYVNPGYTSHVAGMTHEESDAVLGFLFAHCTRPEFVYRHRWRVGDLVMWDNRATMHHAIGDYGDARRHMHRTTIMG